MPRNNEIFDILTHDEQMMTASDIARRLNVPVSEIRKDLKWMRARQGWIHAEKVGGVYHYAKSDEPRRRL
jgi:Mn-dependent DtxR family transcriptional regulator